MKQDLSKRPAAGLKIERVTVRTGINAGALKPTGYTKRSDNTCTVTC